MTPLRCLVHLSDQIAAVSSAALPNPDHALLQKIADLETAMGVPLLAEREHGLVLTPAGEDLVAYARQTIPELSTTAPLSSSAPPRNAPERRFVTPQVETDSIALVDQTMKFAAGLARARSSMFFWISPNCEIIDARCRNIEEKLVSDYVADMREDDPLHIAKLKSSGQLIATLNEAQNPDAASIDKYKDFCSSIGIGDEIDMLFWRAGRPFACLALFRSPDDPPFSMTEIDWEALRRHVQASLRMHWRVRSDEVERILLERYGLQPREMDVVGLIMQGKSNADISDILQISIATVKVHVVNILRKLGVDSRLAVACVISRLQQA